MDVHAVFWLVTSHKLGTSLWFRPPLGHPVWVHEVHATSKLLGAVKGMAETAVIDASQFIIPFHSPTTHFLSV